MGFSTKTKLILATGKAITMDQVTAGMELMGPDSLPRKVVSVNPFIHKMYLVIRSRGEALVTDGDQIFPLKKPKYLNERFFVKRNGRMIEKINFPSIPDRFSIKVIDMIQNAIFGRRFLLFKEPISYLYRPVPVDPYFLGLWLGDGTHTDVSITTMDEPIAKEVYEQARLHNLNVLINPKANNNKASTYIINRGGGRGNRAKANTLLDKI